MGELGQNGKRCYECASINHSDNVNCTTCGVNLEGLSSIETLDPLGNRRKRLGKLIQVRKGTHPVGFVIVMSILFGGWVGMIINRQITKAFVFGLLIGGALAIATMGISLIVWYPLMLIDAIMTARKLNDGRAVYEWEYF